GTLTVTATTVPTGISVTNIVNSGGTVTADVAAGCNATTGANTIVLTVTNGTTGLMNTANLTVNVIGSEIDVTGDGFTIADGDTSPSTDDLTDFGSANVTGGTVSHDFTIENT